MKKKIKHLKRSWKKIPEDFKVSIKMSITCIIINTILMVLSLFLVPPAGFFLLIINLHSITHVLDTKRHYEKWRIERYFGLMKIRVL